MTGFKITLEGKEYEATYSQSDSKGNNNWVINFKHGDAKANIEIPMDAKVTRAKALLFIEAFHEGLKSAFSSQGIDQNYIWNQKKSIN